jgi:hypothetical protein
MPHNSHKLKHPPPRDHLLLYVDANNPFGSGCPKGEGCCRETNTCVKISSCADFAKVCPPSTCAKDLSFSEVEVSEGRKGRGARRDALVVVVVRGGLQCLPHMHTWQ